MTPSTAIASNPRTENEGVRRRSLSGASALLTRRFTRQTSAPRPTASRSESTARRRATIAATSDNTDQPIKDSKVHVRIVPSIENPSRCLIFDIVDRQLEVGSVIRIGRYSERHANLNCMSFRSKVVSRCHCEVFVENDGKLYIRDTKSSSGTFLNHVRLSAAGVESRPVELKDGDIVQLGVDFQGGREEMYRSVKMRFELNRSSRPRPLSFSLNAFQNLRNLTQQQQVNHRNANSDNAVVNEEKEGQEGEHVSPLQTSTKNDQPDTNNHVQQLTQVNTTNTTTTNNNNNVIPPTALCNTNTTTTSSTEQHACKNDMDECVICLASLRAFQALFVAPCLHTYHYKCIRPLLQSYPGFQCPICRAYSDLEANVEEADEVEVIEKQNNNRSTFVEAAAASATDNDGSHHAPPADSGLGLQSVSSSDIMLLHHHDAVNQEEDHLQTDLTLTTTRTRTVDDMSPTEDRGFSFSVFSSHQQNNQQEGHHAEAPGSRNEETTTFSPVIHHSETAPNPLPLESNRQYITNSNVTSPVTTTNFSESHHHVIEGSNVTTDDSVEDNAVMSNTEEEDNNEEDEEDEGPTSTTSSNVRPRERRTSHIMDKIKMVFFEKRKASTTSTSTTNKNQRHNISHKTPRPRPLSYPNILHNHHQGSSVPAATSSSSPINNESQSNASSSSSSMNVAVPLSQTLSRQSTTHPTEADEEFDPRDTPYSVNNSTSRIGGGSRSMVIDL